MKIYSWNVNGIRAVVRKGAFAPFIELAQPDVLCIQETKAQADEAAVDLPGYFGYWNSAQKKGYSGTAIFSKTEALSIVNDLPEDLQAKYDMTADGFGDPNTEGRIQTAEFENFYLVNVYTPNAKDDLSRIPLLHTLWSPAFLEYIKRLELTKPVIFCGDLNVAHTGLDLSNPKGNQGKKGFTDEERADFQSYLSAGFVDTLRMYKQGHGFYTWWSHFAKARERNVGWRIDYVLVSTILKSKVLDADIHPTIMGSDHCPISITLDI